MNRQLFFCSFIISCCFILGSLFVLSRQARLGTVGQPGAKQINPRIYRFNSTFVRGEGSSCVATKEFVNSHVFSEFSIEERTSIVEQYLHREAKPVYECVLKNERKKCFKYTDKDSIYAPKKYRIEDMTMRYPYTYHTVINNPTVCTDDTYIVVGSPVGPRQFVERVATRNAWGNVREVDGKKVIHLFFAGKDENAPVGDRMLREENDKYHDIIQFDMKNHFMNLTLLAILTYNWTHHYCPHIAYYVRSDNDMYYNPRLHIRTFLMEERSQTLIGNIVTGSKPIRIQQSRYWMPKSVFPRSMFDPYPSGCFVTITGDALRTIVEGSEKSETILYFDDVFLGMVARKTDLTLLTYPGNTLFFYTQAFKPGAYAKMSAAHRYAPVDLLALWQIVDR